MIEKEQLDILAISEANISNNTFIPQIQIEGFSIEYDSRKEEGKTVRLVLLISDRITYKRRRDLEPKSSAAIWIQVGKGKNKWLLFAGYREFRLLADHNLDDSGNTENQTNRLNEWKDSWSKADKENKEMMIIGDFNADMSQINEETNETNTNPNQITRLLMDMAGEIGATIVKTQPTRYQGMDPPSTLDLIIVNKPELIKKIKIRATTSDHQLVVLTKLAKVKPEHKQTKRGRNYKEYSADTMRELMRRSRNQAETNSDDPNQLAKDLNTRINEALDITAPFKTKQPRKAYAAHLTKETKEEMTKRDQIKRLKQEQPLNTDIRAEYNKIRNKVTKLQRENKRTWVQKKLEGDDQTSKKLWNTVNTLTGKKAGSSISLILKDGYDLTKSTEIAEELSSYFENKILALIETLPKNEGKILEELKKEKKKVEEECELQEITMVTLDTYIKEMKNSPASGPDSINANTMKDIYPIIREELLTLVNSSLRNDKYPEIHKIAKIIPIAKQGKDKKEKESYRPVASLNLIGKIIERAAFDQIANHMEKNNLIGRNQHGGRKGHSTTTCLTDILEGVTKAKEGKRKVALLALDLSAAYDMCHHGILKEKMRILSVGKKAMKFVESFLDDRYQVVEVNGYRSEHRKMGTTGVVQGGRSSGSLFTYYMNELSESINKMNENILTPLGDRKNKKLNRILKELKQAAHDFVDDVTAIIHGANNSELQNNLQEAYNRMEKYLTDHRMIINGGKSQLCVISKKEEDKLIHITAGGQRIIHQEQLRILGVTIASDLSFTNHIWEGKNSMMTSLNKKAAMLRIIKPYIKPEKLYAIGNAILNSIISYAAPVWGGTTQENIARIQKKQIKVAKLLAGWRKSQGLNEHRNETLQRVGWRNVNQIVNCAFLKYVNKAMNQESSAESNQMFEIKQKRNPRGEIGIRLKHKGPVNRNRNAFSERGSELYNQLPGEWRRISMPSKIFKNKIKNDSWKWWLLENHKLTLAKKNNIQTICE